MRKTMENTYHLFLDHLERETQCQTTKHQSMHHFWTPSREAIISARNELAIQASNALVRLSLDGGRVLAAIHLATNSFRASLKDPSKLTVNPKSDSTFAGSAFRGSAGSELCPFWGTPFLTHLSCQAWLLRRWRSICSWVLTFLAGCAWTGSGGGISGGFSGNVFSGVTIAFKDSSENTKERLTPARGPSSPLWLEAGAGVSSSVSG